jgi:hypothetical protein
VHSDQDVKSFADLKGKRIATTTGTTAHVLLDKPLRAKASRTCKPEHAGCGRSESLSQGDCLDLKTIA